VRHLRGRALALSALSAATAAAADPGPRVCVTFDDAFACLLENVLPITRALGIPVTIFVPTDNLGRSPAWAMRAGHPDAQESVMTADEIRTAHQPGMVDFGSHTCRHADLPRLGRSATQHELARSRQVLEALLGAPVYDLALPYGAYDAGVLAASRAAGYTRIFTLDARLACPADGGVYGRFLMSPDVWPIEFHLTCAGAYAWLHAWRGFWRRLRVVLRGPPLLSPST
jgi:peptidoglycan/xylan/chitin deacetylase (PgdA/CDA1 family)